jgi:hypothetical protein
MRRRLDSFRDWTRKEVIESTDVFHASRTRGTVRPGHPHEFILKSVADRVDVVLLRAPAPPLAAAAGAAGAAGAASSSSSSSPQEGGGASAGEGEGGGELLRFTCCTETVVGQPPPSDPPTKVRLKRRYRFDRKGEFLYELTEVRSGADLVAARAAAATYEVELEWVGRAGVPAYLRQAGGAKLLVEKFVMKAADLVVMRRESMRGGGGAGALAAAK